MEITPVLPGELLWEISRYYKVSIFSLLLSLIDSCFIRFQLKNKINQCLAAFENSILFSFDLPLVLNPLLNTSKQAIDMKNETNKVSAK